MVAYITVRSLSRDLSIAARVHDVGQALLAAARNFGFAHVVIGATAPNLPDAPLVQVFSSAPGVAFDLRAQHPFVAMARETDMPFGFSEAHREGGTDPGAWARRLAPEFEAFDGIVVPVHDEARLAWWICFAGERPPVNRHAMCMLAAASYAAWARTKAISQPGHDGRSLTPREIDCLRLTATGKSDNEVGHALGISGRTVRFHITNAKDKLGANSRLQAVARVMGVA